MKMNVAVFMGGKSCEHEISCISASQVIKALDEDKYEIIPIYIAKYNDMYTGSALMDISNFADNIINKLEKVCIYKDGSKVYVKPINGLFKKAQCIDVAFEVVHGIMDSCDNTVIHKMVSHVERPKAVNAGFRNGMAQASFLDD